MNDAPTNLRDGRYAIVRLLGEGAQAATFEAVDKKEGRPVAIKRFRVRGAKSWKEVELAEREARVLSGLTHPGLPKYVEHFEENGELFLVTERIEGESLAATRRRGAGLGEADVVAFLRDAAAILDYLHGRAPPLVHRDIKPSNVIRRPDGRFVLIDFGAVRDKMKPEGGSTVVGTFGYMAPEQFQGRAMPASDVYAVGATALVMLTGREPEDLPHKGLAIDVAASAPPTTSPALVRALEAMLEPDPDRRASRIGPLVESLRSAAPNPTPSAKPSSPRAAKDTRRGLEQDFERDIEEAVHHIEQGFSRLGEEWRREAQKDKWTRKAEKAARKVERKAERDARRHERRAERFAHRAEAWNRTGPPEGLPQPIAGLFLLGLMIAQIAVMVALRVVVPVLLTVLSVFFGKGMRNAAKRVFEAGKTAHEAMERAKGVIRSQVQEAPGGARIAEQPEENPARTKARIATDEAEAPDEDEARAEEEAAEAEAAQKKRRAR
jgi:tRNA A-37 threonylcarbamoyl transferase component Bud32